MRIILASASPRRKELMDLLNIQYEIIVSNEKEVLEGNLSLKEQSEKLAYIKANSVFENIKEDRIVIGSDTMVIKDNKLYGKPKDRKNAIDMINSLKNSKHQVITSICILIKKGEIYKEYLDCDITDVYISDITNKEIEDWVENGNPFDKAGAYAIQGEFGVYVERINGNYNSVVGLPINKVYKILKQYIKNN